LTKGDIARTQKIFYHIRQVAARVAKLIQVGTFEAPILEEGRSWSQRW